MRTCPSNIKAKLYQTFVRPTIEYCCTVWDPHTDSDIKLLESVQKRAARFSFNKPSRYDRVTPMLIKLNWIPLVERRARAKLTLLFKAIKDIVDVPLNHLRLTITPRRGNHYFLPYCRTNTLLHSYFMNTIRLWNGIPSSAKSASSLSSFQAALSSHTARRLY